MASDLLKLEWRGPLAIITMQRAERLNALPDLDDGQAFETVCRQINETPAARCALLLAEGRAFSAGGDLRAMSDRRDLFAGTGTDIRERYRRVVHRIVRAVHELEVPLIAGVNGPAMGLGCDLAGLADIRIASSEARFGVPFLKLGIIPGDGGAWLLPRHIGHARAAQMLFTGESIEADTALAWGLVNAVVAPEALHETCEAWAARITDKPPQALRMAKSLLRQGREASFEQMLELSAAMQALAHLSDDHIEGVRAVLEKRPADFTGA